MYPRYDSVSILVSLLMKDSVDFFIYIYSAKESKILAFPNCVPQWLQAPSKQLYFKKSFRISPLYITYVNKHEPLVKNEFHNWVIVMQINLKKKFLDNERKCIAQELCRLNWTIVVH